jgi:uncharacterized membrane protein YcjF (UPF0283 family)
MRRVLSNWVFVVLVGSLGMLAVVPFTYAAIRLRRRSLWGLAALYLVVDLLMWALFSQDDLGDAGAGLTALLWLGMVVVVVVVGWRQLSRLRREMLGERVRRPVVH